MINTNKRAVLSIIAFMYMDILEILRNDTNVSDICYLTNVRIYRQEFGHIHINKTESKYIT